MILVKYSCIYTFVVFFTTTGGSFQVDCVPPVGGTGGGRVAVTMACGGTSLLRFPGCNGGMGSVDGWKIETGGCIVELDWEAGTGYGLLTLEMEFWNVFDDTGFVDG